MLASFRLNSSSYDGTLKLTSPHMFTERKVEVSGAESRQPKKVAMLIESNSITASTIPHNTIHNGCQDQISSIWASQSPFL
jgi:hypothetical protein